jgi:hypothetical protein
MKSINIFLVCFILVAGTAGCKKFVEKGNVNVNPNQPSTVTLNTLLPAVAYATSFNQAYVAYITSMFTGQMAAYSSGPINEDQNRDVRISTGYYSLYVNGMTNAKLLLEMARAQGSPHYMAISRILFVTNLQLATDTWGDVPLSTAFQSPEVLYPSYDKQEDIYAFMQKFLDSAVTEIAQTNPSTLKPGVDDLIFGGVMNSWKETAWFLKARLWIHTTKKNATTAETNALAAVANGFTANSKDYQMIFSDRNPNPWYVNVSGRISGSQVFTIAPAKRFLDATTGVVYPGLFDPRIDKLVFKSGTSPTYVGLINGVGNTGTNNTNLTDVTFYAQKTSPLVIGSYAEQKLIESEARFILNGGTVSTTGTTQAAYDAYKAAIVANLQKLGLPATYASNPLVDVGAANLKLEHIMREKQVVLFLNPEAWTDMRRYDYNPNLFRGISVPANQDAAMGGQYIRRALYPLDEVSRNPKAQAAIKPLTEKVWWDQ